MKRYFTLLYELLAITVFLYLVRPLEGVIVGLMKAAQAFYQGFHSCVWQSGWEPKKFYQAPITKFKEANK